MRAKMKGTASLTIILSLSLMTGCSFLSSIRGGETLPSETEPYVVETTLVTEFVPETEAQTEETTVETTDISPMAEDLVTLLYNNLLDRDPSADELEDYARALSHMEIGADQIVRDILEGDEFEGLEFTDTEYVTTLVTGLTDRYPGEQIISFFEGKLTEDFSRMDLANFIMAADDSFSEMCNSYGFLPERELVQTNPYDALLNAPVTTGFGGLGNYIPDDTTLSEIKQAIDDLRYSVSFTIVDIESGNGLVYNTARDYYSASAIKGPYAASFIAYNPDTAMNWEGTIQSMLVHSDNDAFTRLFNSYRRVPIQAWCEEAGVDPAACTYKYPRLTSVQLAQLWLRNYRFFVEDPNGEYWAPFFQEPLISAVHGELGEEYITESKAGWLVDDNPQHTTSVDAGIVHSAHGDYIVSIMSTYPSNVAALCPLVEALDHAHQLM